MATESEVLDILATLQAAFPAYRPANPQTMADLWIRKLGKFDQRALTLAMDRLIDECKFFPSISEFTKAVNRVGDVVVQSDWMRAKAVEMQDRAYLEDDFDPAEWEQLACQMAGAGRLFAADALREKAARIGQEFGEPVQ